MKRIVLVIYFFIASINAALSAVDFATSFNLLPYDWKISNDTAILLTNSRINVSEWNVINLGVSWERQGYFYASGELILANYFNVPDIQSPLSDEPFQLTINLQCKILELYVNGDKVSGSIDFKDSPSIITIAKNKLRLKGDNLIAIRIKDVQWTGGVCKNIFNLTHPDFGLADSIVVQTTVPDNLFKQARDIDLKINYKVTNPILQKIKIKVVSDFLEIIETKYYDLAKQEGILFVKLNDKLYKPGLYHVLASTEGISFSQKDLWFAVAPEKIKCDERPPDDLKSWWENTRKELYSIPSDIKLTKTEEGNNHLKDVYEVEMSSLDRIKVYGYLFVPKKKGKYPAILHVPGYSMSYDKHSFQGDDNVIEFAFNIRGHGPSVSIVNPGFGLLGFVGYNICNKEKYAYRGAYMDCLRAIDFLYSRSEVDTSRIGVMGMSQGGGLALATAALAGNKVKACATLSPFLCDLKHHAVIRHVFALEKEAFSNAFGCNVEHINHTLEYVDTKNMAQWITAAVFMGTGFYDDDCPSHVGFASFNEIKSNKQFKVYPDEGHLLSHGMEDGRIFLKKELGF